jgi:diacylglycerol kinase family enzyme
VDHPLLGVIPSGNANDHYRAVAKGSMVRHIAKGHSKPLDVLRVVFMNSKGKEIVRYAHSYIGFGLTSYIRKELDRENVNAFTEKIVAARSFVASRPIKIRRLSEDLELDSLLFTNINVIAKIFKFSKHTAPDDGKFEVHVIHHSTQLHKAGEVMRLRSKKSTVRSRRTPYAFTALGQIDIQIDGEILKVGKDSRVVIDVLPHAIRTVL